MDRERIRRLLDAVQHGQTSVEEALELLKLLPFEDYGFARLDNHRSLRRGFPEVVFCQGKTPQQVQAIIEGLSCNSEVILATRAGPDVVEAVRQLREDMEYNPLARCMVVGTSRPPKSQRTILVISAGTADLPVAEEAVVTAQTMGNRVQRLYDVGVAGLHRLLAELDCLYAANVLVVVAGMEGALPSVVAGLVARPVIAVPTSVGYGASFQGMAALLSMLNSCSPGLAVVNIDNGFGAGYLASLINEVGEGLAPDSRGVERLVAPAA